MLRTLAKWSKQLRPFLPQRGEWSAHQFDTCPLPKRTGAAADRYGTPEEREALLPRRANGMAAKLRRGYTCRGRSGRSPLCTRRFSAGPATGPATASAACWAAPLAYSHSCVPRFAAARVTFPFEAAACLARSRAARRGACSKTRRAIQTRRRSCAVATSDCVLILRSDRRTPWLQPHSFEVR